MKRILLAAAVLMAVFTPAALALPGSVSVTTTATDAVCDGTSTVSITLQSVAPPPESAPLDLVIAIDESGSLSTTAFNQEKQAAVAFVNALDFTGGVRKVGVLAFSQDARVIINLSNNKAAVIAAINSIVQRRGGTNITDAVRDSRTMVTNPAQGAQAGAAKVMLLMTDGQNTLETAQLNGEVSAFKAIPGEIFALGFGSSLNVPQLNMIASDPDSTHVYITPDTTELSAIAAEIAEQIQSPAATDVELQVAAGAPFSFIAGSESASVGATSPLAGGLSWSLPTLGTETQTLTFQVQHSGNEDGSFDALSLFALTYLDGDLNPASMSPSSPTITVSGCNDAPTADAGPDQTVSLTGLTVDVDLDGSGSSDPDPQDTLSYSWSLGGSEIATGATPTVALGLGTHTITLTVSDGRLSDTDEVVIDVELAASGLCALTELYVEHHGVAHSLCVKLEHGSIRAYVNEVNAQRGKRLTNAEADELIALALTL